MRAVLSFLALAVGVAGATFASAADTPPHAVQRPVMPPDHVEHRGALLQLSPIYVEIRDTLAVLDAREKQLLAELAVATDDATAEAIVREFESLPLERVLCVLRIQARYARKEGRPDLERQLRQRIVELRDGANNRTP
ncbi:MAG: hypothetical protein IPK64_13070 [bacterium]|nr:hypothetical protein [bacterium]